MTVREILHAHIPYLNGESTVRDAIDKMDIYQFPALVIVNNDLRPEGVITEGDICRAARSAGGVTTIAYQYAKVYGTGDPVCVSPQIEISDALEQMLSSGLTLLPVVEGNTLLGVVLRVDLMQAMLLDTEPPS